MSNSLFEIINPIVLRIREYVDTHDEIDQDMRRRLGTFLIYLVCTLDHQLPPMSTDQVVELVARVHVMSAYLDSQHVPHLQ